MLPDSRMGADEIIKFQIMKEVMSLWMSSFLNQSGSLHDFIVALVIYRYHGRWWIKGYRDVAVGVWCCPGWQNAAERCYQNH